MPSKKQIPLACILKALLCFLLLALFVNTNAQNDENVRLHIEETLMNYSNESENRKQSTQWKIDEYINKLREDYGIPAVALAVIKNGKILHQKYYGNVSIEHQVPVTEHSIFRLYSLTKPIIAVGVFQLIEQGKLDLDDAAAKYVSDLPKAWNQVRIKHLLSFSSGLPELIEPYKEVRELDENEIKNRVYKEGLQFNAGDKFEYNQTNFWLLQKIIENISGETLSSFILENQFRGSTVDVFFSSDSRDIIVHRATPYFPFEKGHLTITHPYYQGNYSHAMNGLNLTLNAFIKWDKQFNNHEFLTEKTRTKMWSSFKCTSDDNFSHGWANFSELNSKSYGFSGSGSTVYRTFPDEELSIIYLSNGFSKNYDLNEMISQIRNYIITTKE